MTLRCVRCSKPTAPEDFCLGARKSWCRPCGREYDRQRYLRAHGVVTAKPPAKLSATRPERDDDMLAIGEGICRKCPKAHHAVDAITSVWWALKESEV